VEAAFNVGVVLRPPGLGTIDYAFIGKSRFDNDPAFDGVVDSFNVYNRALSTDEIQRLFTLTTDL
jgi:hypothetical protein